MPVTDRPLFLSIDASHDWLTAVEYGCVLDGPPENHYLEIDDAFAFILRGPGDEVIGFSVGELGALDLDLPELWEVPLFDVPTIGLEAAPAGAVITAAQHVFPDLSTADVLLFEAAVETEDPERAELAWRVCLGAGDLKAH